MPRSRLVRGRLVKKAPTTKSRSAGFSLSVIIPVFNEERTIGRVLDLLLQQKDVSQVVIMNDGSTDRTAALIQRYLKVKKISKRRVQFYTQSNQGKGAAVRKALNFVTKKYVLIQDADLEYDPYDIAMLVQPIKRGRAQVVYGSRFLGPHSNLLFWHRVGNFFLNLLTDMLYNTTISDLETCYKIVPTELLRSLKLTSHDFTLEPEITCKILRRNIRIFETPISYVGRDYSEGKKINWRHGFGAFWAILKLRFTPQVV
jgi:glycosyltransferase involved in cell wall biosynthesis